MIDEIEIKQELQKLKENLLKKHSKKFIACQLEISIRQLERLFNMDSKITFIQYKKLKSME